MIPIFGLLGALTYPLVLVASAIGATFDPVGVTAREALLPDVAKRARLELENVNGVHEAVWGLAWLVGPGIAGVLIATIGAVASFWAMFAGFVISALLVGTARMPAPAREHDGDGRWVSEALEGLRFVVRDPAIRATTVLSTISFTLVYSVIAVVLPVVYERIDEPRQLGALFMAFSAGGIVGSLLYSALGTRLSRRLLFAVGLVAIAAVSGAFATTQVFWVLMLVMALGGFLTGPVNPIANVVLQERTGEEMRGRALSMVFAFAYALFPVGYVSAGFMIKAAGVTRTFGIFAVASAVVAVWSMLTPALRGMGQAGAATAQAEGPARD